MKRSLFIGSVATVISFLPSLARAEAPTQNAATQSNEDGPGWPKPPWSCDRDVVWIDTPSGVYYREGDSEYGRTERGAYACEKHAAKTGTRAS
jgi:hypothetical protein